MRTIRGKAVRRRALAVTLIAEMIPAVAGAVAPGLQSGTILAAVQTAETGSYSNPYAVNTGTGYYGAFQQGTQALTQIGYMNSNGTWNAAASGAASLQDYLNCSTCQINGETAILQSTWSQLQANGAVSQYLGQTAADGNVMNESALLECGQNLGAQGCLDYMEGNPIPSEMAANPNIAQNIALASESDSSAITGGNTLVNNSANAAGGTVSAGTAAAQMMTYCSQQVQQLLAAAGAQEVNRQSTLAASKIYGYTLMDGNGIADDAQATGTNSGFNGLSQVGYAAKSCLQNLLSQLSGLSMLFSVPSLSSLLSQAINAACNMAEASLTQTLTPLYQKVGDINNMGYVGGGGFMPGLQLFNAQMTSGGSGGLIQVQGSSGSTSIANLQSLMNGDSSWYMSTSGGGGLPLNYNQPIGTQIQSQLLSITN